MARTARSLWPKIVTRDNVEAAYLEARRGKRRRADVSAFMLREEEEVARLASELESNRWQPGGHRTFFVTEPKRRLISAAPFVDRVVHHAVHRVLAPVLLRRHLPESFACLPGRGTHRAVLAFRAGLRAHRFVGRIDVRRYFLEIDWDVLLGIVRRAAPDLRLLDLVERVLGSGAGLYSDRRVLEHLGLADAYVPRARKGLPIGSLTSQLFANVYLDGADHFIKRKLRAPAYVRYSDDLVIFGDRRGEVAGWMRAVRDWLQAERDLETRMKGMGPASCAGSFRFLGYTVGRDGQRPSGPTLRRVRARMRAQARRALPGGEAEALTERWCAWAKSLVL